MTCAHCEDLAERIAYLESELGLRTDADEIETLKRAFRITRGLAVMLRVLFLAKGRTVTNWQLFEAMPHADADTAGEVIKVQISHLRKAIGRELVETIWGQGYRLSAEGRLRVGAILQPQPESVCA